MNEIYILPFNEETDRPNICYIKGSNQSILVDCGGGPTSYQMVMEFLNKNNLPYPTYIVLTHYHWDHAFGIGYYSSKVISSKYTNDKLEEMINLHPKCVMDFIRDDLQPLFCLPHLNIEYPDLKSLKIRTVDIITKSLTIDLGDRSIDILEVPSPHTEGSLVLYDRNSKTIFLGDAIYGRIEGEEFIDNAKKMQEFLDAISIFPFEYAIIGHAPKMTREELFLY